jgi:hypothetical protein
MLGVVVTGCATMAGVLAWSTIVVRRDRNAEDGRK